MESTKTLSEKQSILLRRHPGLLRNARGFVRGTCDDFRPVLSLQIKDYSGDKHTSTQVVTVLILLIGRYTVGVKRLDIS